MKIAFPLVAEANSPIVLYNVNMAVQKLPGFKVVDVSLVPNVGTRLRMSFTKNKRTAQATMMLRRGSTLDDVSINQLEITGSDGKWRPETPPKQIGRLDEILRPIADIMTARVGVGL